MTTTGTTVDFRRSYPVFPLDKAVLFPHTFMPLHVFETRYRKLVNDVLDGTGLIVIGRFARSPSPDEYLWGSPELSEDVGLGQVVDYLKTDDGRYHVVLYGLCRAHIVEEQRNAPYRSCTVHPFDVGPDNETELLPLRHMIKALLGSFMDRLGHAEGLKIDDSAPTRIVVDQLLDTFCTDANDRYAMLREADVRRRADWLISFLGGNRNTDM